MAKKYDTNPLDPEFPQRAREEMETQTLPYSGAKTEPFPYAAPTEEQTRKFGEADFSAYSSPFDGQNAPANFQAEQFKTGAEDASKRKVANVGLPENIMVALPYLPFSIGLIASLVELFLVPKSETKVRFHAAQGLAAHIAILIVTGILSGIGGIANFGGASKIFTLVTTVMLIIFAFKAWKGKPVHIEAVDDLTNWLDEKIKPRG